MKNSKTSWLIKHSLTVLSCVAIIALGIITLSYASVTTSIGENIITNILTATGLTVSGNATTTGTLNAQGGITGDLTGNVVGNLTGTSTNAEQLGNVSAADYSTEAERTVALANYMALAGGIISGDLTVSGTTALATTSLATTTISALGSVNGNIIYVKPGETIQSVINSIGDASASNPYVVMIPPGVYTEQITMKDYVSLQGSGRNASIIKIYHTGGMGSYTTGLTLANNVYLSQLSVIPAGDMSANVKSVRGEDKYGVYIDNCILGEEAKGVHGLGLYGEGKYTITNCFIAVLETDCGAFLGEYNLYSCEIVKAALIGMRARSVVVWQSGGEGSVGRLFNCRVHSEEGLPGALIMAGSLQAGSLLEMYNTKVYGTSDYII